MIMKEINKKIQEIKFSFSSLLLSQIFNIAKANRDAVIAWEKQDDKKDEYDKGYRGGVESVVEDIERLLK